MIDNRMNEEKLKNIALELTILTGSVITCEITDYWTNYFHFPDGGRIGITAQRPDQFHFYASSPKDYHGPTVYDAPGMHCNSARTTASIAADIYRRILPAAREYWLNCIEAATKQAQQRAKILETLDLLHPYTNHDSLDSDGTSARASNIRASMQINTSSIRLEAYSISPAEALAILEILEVK